MSGWTHSCCEACWFRREGTFDEQDRLLELRRPVRVAEPELEVCCFCGQATIFGVYVRAAPMESCQHQDEAFDAEAARREEALAEMTWDPEVAKAITDRWAP